jgi:hypothetical protein
MTFLALKESRPDVGSSRKMRLGFVIYIMAKV